MAVVSPEALNLPGIGALTVIIGAVFGAVGYAFASFSKGGKEASGDAEEANKAANEATNFVIGALKEQISLLEKKVSDQATDLQAMKVKLEEIIQENQELKAILQGRDNQTQRFQEEGFKAMEQSALVIATIRTIEERVNKILDIIEHREVVVTQLHEEMKNTLGKAKNRLNK